VISTVQRYPLFVKNLPEISLTGVFEVFSPQLLFCVAAVIIYELQFISSWWWRIFNSIIGSKAKGT